MIRIARSLWQLIFNCQFLKSYFLRELLVQEFELCSKLFSLSVAIWRHNLIPMCLFHELSRAAFFASHSNAEDACFLCLYLQFYQLQVQLIALEQVNFPQTSYRRLL